MDWDSNRVARRYVRFTIKNGKVVFGNYQERRKVNPEHMWWWEEQTQYELQFAFSPAIAKLFGYAIIDELHWETFPKGVD